MGDDLPAIEAALREGRATPFTRWPPAVEYGARCQLIGLYPNDLSPTDLGINKQQARFMGRAALMAARAARIALEQSGVESGELAVVVGSGTGDVDAHVEIHNKLAKTKNAKRVSPTIIPRLMASTVSANLASVLGTTGPSFSATAACAGGAYNVLLAAELIEQGRVESAIAGGVEVADIHFFAGFDSMRAYNGQDNDHPERASRPYAADRAGFIFSSGATPACSSARCIASTAPSAAGATISREPSDDIPYPRRTPRMGAPRRVADSRVSRTTRPAPSEKMKPARSAA